jgi:hypothetical protein
MGHEVHLEVTHLAAVPFLGHLQRDLLQQQTAHRTAAAPV